MLTDREKKFADIKISAWGQISNPEAAEQAGYSKKSAADNAWKLAKKQDIIDYINRQTNGNAYFILGTNKPQVRRPKTKTAEVPAVVENAEQPKFFSNPKDFLLSILNTKGVENKDKIKAAEILMNAERGQIGKKEQRDLFAQSLVNGANDNSVGRFSVFKPVGN